jgi:hypothetical protein
MVSYRETGDVADATARLIRSVGRRVAAEDTHDLAELVKLQAALEAAWSDAITGLRRNYSDAAIGAELEVTKQAIAKRWPRESDETPARRQP